ncbi:hypothetical protein [Terricaulis sp.]|uniref:hypothetical protein n=1 Tax=Terricaulis sp. TaxID=2768686 RepID=UPI002AC7C0D5|nr:hypothetical protein [Terricaulis sp.]MDZ4689706.1 hypothetical protein [Terricaulis sp.]
MLGFLGMAALVLVIGIYLLGGLLLEKLGVIKPTYFPPSGIAVGEEATVVLVRNSFEGKRYLDAYDEMRKVTHNNGEVWRIKRCQDHLDNTYKFTLIRVG